MTINGPGKPPQVNLFLVSLKRLLSAVLRRKPDYAERKPHPYRRQSVAIRVIDCGSGNAVEQEIQALFNPVYDAEQYGFYLVASTRQADVLLLTGPLTRNMEAALLAAFDAMPEPRRVITLGDDMDGRGVFAGSYAIVPLPATIEAARVAHIPGDPPSPDEILTALLKIDFRALSRQQNC